MISTRSFHMTSVTNTQRRRIINSPAILLRKLTCKLKCKGSYEIAQSYPRNQLLKAKKYRRVPVKSGG